jgi:D-alanine-D-alanine ligase
MENMNQLKYNPIPIYITKNNEFYHANEMKDIAFFNDLSVEKRATKVVFLREGNQVYLYEVKNKRLKNPIEVDQVILSVHGTNCEDGTLSAYFELLNIPYVGSNILASAISQNKVTTKIILEKQGLPVIPYTYFNEINYQLTPTDVLRQCDLLGYPLIVKPVSLGSSVGVCQCENRDELIHGIEVAFQYDSILLVEKAIVNMREFNCAVYGNAEKTEASRIEEVIKSDKILSYQDKYLAGSKSKSNHQGIINTKRQIPAELEDDLRDEVIQYAQLTFQALGNSGVSRVDFIYDLDTEHLYINEINTIPGSFAYYLWDQEDLPYDKLIDELIQIGLRNHKRKLNKIVTYDTNILSLRKNNLKNKLK